MYRPYNQCAAVRPSAAEGNSRVGNHRHGLLAFFLLNLNKGRLMYKILVVDDAYGATQPNWAALGDSSSPELEIVQSASITALSPPAEFDLVVLAAHPAKQERSFNGAIARCRQIRTQFAGPLLLLTPIHDEESLVQAYAAGVDECIVEPINMELLLAKVDAWLRWLGSEDCARATAPGA